MNRSIRRHVTAAAGHGAAPEFRFTGHGAPVSGARYYRLLERRPRIGKKTAALQPETAITGHGAPVSGEKLREGLAKLAREFDQIAMPDYGKYVQ